MSSEAWEDYVKDTRTICKYGSNCYQKNPEHHKTYKHPPVKKAVRDKKRYSPYTRKNNANTDKKTDSPQKPVLTKIDSKSNEEASTSVPMNEFDEDMPYLEVKVNLPDDLKYFSSNTDIALFKELFLVNMPSDFFKFFECLSEDSLPIEKVLSSVNLELIGPYDLLLGKLPEVQDKDLYLVHWRFYYDPPEFQAIIKKKGKSQYHIGYYRDDPNSDPVFLASNDSEKDCRITPMAQNIFAAVYIYLQEEKNASPFTAVSCQKFMEKVKAMAEKHNFPLEEYSMKKRQAHIVARTLHGAGIVVPYNKKNQLGYRNLVESDANIKKLFAKIQNATNPEEMNKALSDLQHVITYANIAVDECDFGTGLEIGLDLFCSGLKKLESSALNSLTAAYNLLNRQAFIRILTAHLKYRRKGPKLSILDFK